jgi:hypothetical protein
MPKPAAQEIETVIAFDRDTGVLDLRVYDHQPKRRRAQLVGTATLRIDDLREVQPLLTEQLRFEDLCIEAETAARKSKKRSLSRQQRHGYGIGAEREKRILIRFIGFPYQSRHWRIDPVATRHPYSTTATKSISMRKHGSDKRLT